MHVARSLLPEERSWPFWSIIMGTSACAILFVFLHIPNSPPRSPLAWVALCVAAQVLLVLGVVANRPGQWREAFGLRWPGWRSLIAWTGGYAVVVSIVPAALSALHVTKAGAAGSWLPDDPGPSFWLFAGTIACFVAPVSEELFFRGFLLGLGKAAGVRPLALVLATAALFTVMHMERASTVVLAWTFAVGLLLGVARLRSGSLYPCIAMHAVQNLLMGGLAMFINLEVFFSQ